MSVKRIDLSWITVSDIKKSREFFVDILGFNVTTFVEEYGWMELIAQDGGMMLGVAKLEYVTEQIN